MLVQRSAPLDPMALAALAVAYGVCWAVIGGWFTVWERRWNARLVEAGTARASLEAVGWYQGLGILLTGAWGACLAVGAVAAGAPLLAPVVAGLAPAVERWLHLVTAGLLGAGVATAIMVFGEWRLFWALGAGALGAALWIR